MGWHNVNVSHKRRASYHLVRVGYSVKLNANLPFAGLLGCPGEGLHPFCVRSDGLTLSSISYLRGCRHCRCQQTGISAACRIIDKAQGAATPDEKLALQRLHRRLNSVHEELQIYNSLLQRFKDAPRYSSLQAFRAAAKPCALAYCMALWSALEIIYHCYCSRYCGLRFGARASSCAVSSKLRPAVVAEV